jgi:phosphate transport system substrate-binding protein
VIAEDDAESCAADGIEYLELPVADDGMTVVVNPENDWAQCLTVDELRRVWQPGSTIQNWSQIRDGFPDAALELYGPDTDSGTFDYFTEAIVGEEDASRSDYTASTDDNVLVIGVEGDRTSLGYFGYAYYEQNTDRVKALEIDNGDGCVAPTRETVESGDYAPLSRPLFIYVKRSALERPVVEAFVRFYLESAREIVPQVGYVPLPEGRYTEVLGRLPEAATGG